MTNPRRAKKKWRWALKGWRQRLERPTLGLEWLDPCLGAPKLETLALKKLIFIRFEIYWKFFNSWPYKKIWRGDLTRKSLVLALFQLFPVDLPCKNGDKSTKNPIIYKNPQNPKTLVRKNNLQNKLYKFIYKMYKYTMLFQNEFWEIFFSKISLING